MSERESAVVPYFLKTAKRYVYVDPFIMTSVGELSHTIENDFGGLTDCAIMREHPSFRKGKVFQSAVEYGASLLPISEHIVNDTSTRSGYFRNISVNGASDRLFLQSAIAFYTERNNAKKVDELENELAGLPPHTFIVRKLKVDP